MGFLQACSFFSEQMPYDVTIDINKFLGAFSVVVDGQCVCPPSWVKNQDNSVGIVPSASTSSTPPSTSAPIFNMDHYRTYRQAEALQWINLQEKRSSIIARLQPTSAEEYQKLREAIMTETVPLRRKPKKQTGMKTIPIKSRLISFFLFNQQLKGLQVPKIKTIWTTLPIYRVGCQIFLQNVSLFWLLVLIIILTSFYVSETKRKRLDMNPVSKSIASSNLIKIMELIKGQHLKDLSYSCRY